MLDELLNQIEDTHGSSFEGAVIGIDLGTTNSVVYTIVNGQPKCILDVENAELQPSVVSWTPDGNRLVGTAAKQRRVVDPENTVFSAKRLIGQSFQSEAVQRVLASLPYRVQEGEQQEILVGTREGFLPVPVVSSYVLGYLKWLAEQTIGQTVTHCVVTVPANFSDSQRAATRRAANLAGMEVLRVLNEPTAAAIAYGEGREIQQRIAVFDLGGGTFDISVLGVRDKLYEVIATGGDSFLGGDDIDRILYDWLAQQFLQAHRIDPNTDPTARARLLMVAEQIKLSLSSEMFVEGELAEVSLGPGGNPLGLRFSITREVFEQMIASFAFRTMEVTGRVLQEAHLVASDIDEVILVGGSTCIPLIQRLVSEKFGTIPKCHLDPMKVVALGAALQAERLVHPTSDQSVLLDVTPHSLRISTVSGFSQVLVKKNTTIPAEGVASFFTAKDNQSSVTIRISQGEREAFRENVPLGELVLQGLPPGARGEVGVQVAFTIDADGILQVSARDTRSNSVTSTTLSMIGLQEVR